MDTICACKGCTHRMVGCHGRCKDYQLFVTQRRAMREALRMRQSAAREQIEYGKAVHQKLMRQSGRKRG